MIPVTKTEEPKLLALRFLYPVLNTKFSGIYFGSRDILFLPHQIDQILKRKLTINDPNKNYYTPLNKKGTKPNHF